MAIKYTCTSCGATMTLASQVSTVKCPVCRLDMAPVGETEAAIPRSPAIAQPAAHSPTPNTSAAGGTTMPAGIKIARAAGERGGQASLQAGETGPSASASQGGPPADTAAHKLMADARAEADRIIQEAQRQREEILDHAEEHAKQQVEDYFEAARQEAAEIENKAREEAEKLLVQAKAGKSAPEAGAPPPKTTATDETAPSADEPQPLPASPPPPLSLAPAQAASDVGFETAIQAAVDKALRDEREQVANQPSSGADRLGSRHDARRESRLVLISGGFGVVVMVGCLTILTVPQSVAARNLTLAALLLFTLAMFAALSAMAVTGNIRKTGGRRHPPGAARVKPESPPTTGADDAPDKDGQSPMPKAAGKGLAHTSAAPSNPTPQSEVLRKAALRAAKRASARR